MKIEVKVPKMLSSGASKTPTPKKATPKPEGGAMALGGPMSWKPPSKKEMHKMGVHHAANDSMRKWLAGDISTEQHKKNIDRAHGAMKHASSYGLGIKR